jgi:hypothetical protein
MGPTKADPVDAARMIVRNCLAREDLKLIAGKAGRFTTALREFEEYRDGLRPGAPIQRRLRASGGVRPAVDVSWTVLDAAALLFVLVSCIALVAWLVSAR